MNDRNKFPSAEAGSSELERLRKWQRKVEEAEARCCPEDYGFEEYIGVLNRRLGEKDVQLAAMSAAVNAMNVASSETGTAPFTEAAADPSKPVSAVCALEGCQHFAPSTEERGELAEGMPETLEKHRVRPEWYRRGQSLAMRILDHEWQSKEDRRATLVVEVACDIRDAVEEALRVAPSSIAPLPADIERRIVDMIRYVSVKAGVSEATYGAMCHEARCILRSAHLDYALPSAKGGSQ